MVFKSGKLWKSSGGNSKGRYKGMTLKEYQRYKFNKMTEDEKDAFLSDISKIERWKMAEGLPHSTQDVTTAGKPLPAPINGGTSFGTIQNSANNSAEESERNDEENPGSSGGDSRIQDY